MLRDVRGSGLWSPDLSLVTARPFLLTAPSRSIHSPGFTSFIHLIHLMEQAHFSVFSSKPCQVQRLHHLPRTPCSQQSFEVELQDKFEPVPVAGARQGAGPRVPGTTWGPGGSARQPGCTHVWPGTPQPLP